MDWCETTGLDLSYPMFDIAIERHLLGGGRFASTTLSSLAAVPSTPAPAGFIYHVSRCGSTLLSNLLQTSGEAVSLSEPMIACSTLRNAELWERAGSPTLRAFAAAYDPVQVFVKFTADAVSSWRQIEASFPNVPRLFLYRDPIEVVVSLVGSSHDRLPPGLSRLGLIPGDVDGVRPAEFWARVVGKQLQAGIASFREAAGRQLLLNYADLPESVFDRVVPFLGLRLSPAGIDRMRAASRRSAKAWNKPFVQDRESKQQSATAEIRDAVRAYAYDPFVELEGLRLGSLHSARGAIAFDPNVTRE